MKRSIGVVFVMVVGAGGCEDGLDRPNPRDPLTPDVAESREPALNEVLDTRTPLERVDAAELEGLTPPDRLAPIGRRARAMYDRLHAAGLVR